MYTVIAPIPVDLATAIHPYRQKFDPLVNVISPHISVLAPFPYAGSVEALVEHLSDIGETHAPIKVSLVGWDIYQHRQEQQLRLPVIAGRQEFAAARDHLISGPLVFLARRQNQSYWAHILFGRLKDQTEEEQARKVLKHFKPQFIFRATHLELLQKTDTMSPWELKKRISLKATVAGKGRRSRTPTTPLKINQIIRK